MDWSDIEAVVLGKAPDLFEGVMKPELYLTDALGCRGQAHVPGPHGRVGGWHHRHRRLPTSSRSGRHRTGCWRWPTRSSRRATPSSRWVPGGGASIGAGGAFAPYMRVVHLPVTAHLGDIGPMVAVKDRLNALKNPYAHLKLADISIESVMASPMMWDPVHYLESCPSSDGACAVVFTDQAGGDAAADAGRPRRGSSGTAVRSEPGRSRAGTRCAPEGAADCSADVFAQAGITRPLEQIDCAELYVPFSWYEPMWLEGHHIADFGEGWRMVERGGHPARRIVPGEHVRRGALVQPDRRLRTAPLRRGRTAGAGYGRRAPGRRGQGRPRPGVRGGRPVLQHVGGGQLARPLRVGRPQQWCVDPDARTVRPGGSPSGSPSVNSGGAQERHRRGSEDVRMSTTLLPPPVAPPVYGDRPDHPGDLAHPDPSGPPTQRWVPAALVAILAVTAAAYLWDLSASGYANSFYAAAVQAGTKSWKAFFFGSLDSSNFITVDKSPGSLWVMELSGRLFGFSSWSMLAPQVLEGVAAVGLVYATVKRWFGGPAGLLAGAVLACTPVAALMFRFNNPDALMVLLLTAAAYTTVRALERAGTRWIVATGALVGLAFLAKMLQSFTVLPAFAGVYLFAAPTNLLRRIWQLALGGVAVIVSAGWWVAVVALWPTAARPLIDGSPDNSIVNLIFGYNGLSRLSGGTGGGGTGFSGATGVFRLFNDLMGGQASWLIPAALLALAAGLVWRGRAPRTDRTRAALLLWGGWLLVTGAVFSFSSGVIHTYYTVALAPAIAALVGMGGAMLWQNRSRTTARVLGAVAVVSSAGWAFELLGRTPDYLTWLRPLILVSGALAASAWLSAPSVSRFTRPLTIAAVAFGLAAALSGPLVYTGTTLSTAHTGSIPSAGPAVTDAFGGGGLGGPGGSGRGGRSGLPGRPGTSAVPAAFPDGGRPTSTPGAPPGGPGAGGSVPAAGPVVGSSARGGAVGGAGASRALVRALRSRAGDYRWTAATFGSQSAASLELASGVPVMAIGGFNGQGGNISLATFESYVAEGDIHYFVPSGTGGGGPGGRANSDAAITSWVEAHFAKVTIGGQTVYDLTSPA